MRLKHFLVAIYDSVCLLLRPPIGMKDSSIMLGTRRAHRMVVIP